MPAIDCPEFWARPDKASPRCVAFCSRKYHDGYRRRSLGAARWWRADCPGIAAPSTSVISWGTRKFVDSLLEGRVRCELVSEFLESIKRGPSENPEIPCQLGKYREIHRFWPLTSEFSIESTSRIGDLQSKFPTKWNREIIVPEQGIKSADQGPFLPDQGRPSGSANLPERAMDLSGRGNLAAIRLSPSGTEN